MLSFLLGTCQCSATLPLPVVPRRRRAATTARLAARRPLLKEAEKLDKDLARWQQEKQQIDEQLADPAFYANPDPEKLRTLTTRQQELAATIEAAEQRWLDVHAELDTIGEA